MVQKFWIGLFMRLVFDVRTWDFRSVKKDAWPSRELHVSQSSRNPFVNNNTPQMAPVTGTIPSPHFKVWESHQDWVKWDVELCSESWLHGFGICLVSY
ncbi:hypothetical protein CEXT_66521 [Caerostris extrusa]|uniref:Uncharacterized protein n=1 Tax=Caerostris extrusa TaxID=172846 RepID=A0AAV4XRD1_CAEEX|nr:hypothetical protein CEXT_66521 [Caerostris extrusa]